MEEEGLWVPIGFFIAFTIMVVTFVYFKHKTRMETQRTFRLALEKGNELSPEFIKQLGEPEPPKDRDLRRGLITVAQSKSGSCVFSEVRSFDSQLL